MVKAETTPKVTEIHLTLSPIYVDGGDKIFAQVS